MVEIGIAPRADEDEAPIATPDELRVRPDRLVSAPVLRNDIDPEGESLALVDDSARPAEDRTETEATTIDGRVELTTPADAGPLHYTYEVADRIDNRATGDLIVKVDPKAPLQPPVARDDVVRLSDIVGEEEVSVDVLGNDEDPDGAASALEVTTQVEGVDVTDEGRLDVPLLPERQVIVYSVTDADGQVGRAVVVVPGTESLAAQRPVVRSDAPLPLKVKAGELLEIPVEEFVAVRSGRTPLIPYTEDVVPGPGWTGNDKEKKKDAQTLLFRSEENFYGLTSITFLVADGDVDDEDQTRSAILTLPIEVTASGKTAPQLTLPLIEVAQGGEPWRRDLRSLVTDPDPGDVEAMSFEISGVPPGVAATIADDSTLEVSAKEGLPEGEPRQFTVTATDPSDREDKQQASVVLVSSTRPLMSVRDAELQAEAGKPLSVDVADYVSNPYEQEGEPIELIGQPTLSDPSAGSVSPQGGTRFTVTPGADFSGTFDVAYVVGDATEDPDRQVQGQVRIVVTAAPDPPQAVTAVATESKTVEVNWRPGDNNGSPITSYRVAWNGGEREVGPETSATIDGLINNREYTFVVYATNEVGESEASEPSRKARPDQVPVAPVNLKASFGDKQIKLTWDQPDFEGSPIRQYEVFYNGRIVSTGGPSRSFRLTNLDNGTPYSIKVRAINDAEAETEGRMGAGLWSSPVEEHANAEPGPPVEVSVDPGDLDDSDPSAEISWRPGDDGGHPISRYRVFRVGSSRAVCEGTQLTCQVPLAIGQDHKFKVQAFNREGAGTDGWGDFSPDTEYVRGAKKPGPVKNLSVKPTATSGQVAIQFSEADRNGVELLRYDYRLTSSSSWKAISPGRTLVGGLTNGTTYNTVVRAVGTADRRTAATESPIDKVKPFAPCTVSVGFASNTRSTIEFTGSVTGRGRNCSKSVDPNRTVTVSSGEAGWGASRTHTAVVTTNLEPEDPDNGNRYRTSASASGQTWKIDWSRGPDCGPGSGITNCQYASLDLRATCRLRRMCDA